MAPMLQTHGLAAGYGGVSIVEDLSIDVDAGEVVALLGPNGAGKKRMTLADAPAARVFTTDPTTRR